LNTSGPGEVETDLVTKAQAGNLFAYEELVRRYQRRVYAVAYRIVRRTDVAEDVAQEAFLRAYRAIGRFERGRPFGPWVVRIAANLAINHRRSPRAREQELPEGHAETAATDAGPLAQLLDREATAVLDQAVGRLPAEQRAVFVLRVSENLSYQEIAETLGLSPGTVMSRLSRARDKVRAALAPYLARSGRRAGGSEA
jgi:RNA polymerase sigma-70 factor (ECF subfamily)